MDNSILNSRKQSEIYSDNIRKAFSNSDEMIKTDAQIEFEARVRKGEVEVMTLDELRENHKNYLTEPQLNALDKVCDQLIEKGETSELTLEEFEKLNSALEDRRNLVQKAVPSDALGRKGYLSIYVMDSNESEE